MTTDRTAATWPFWAPSDSSSVEEALDLAGVTTGDHLLDLGCGDGRVLLAAAARGATAAGVDTDGDLVEQARAALAAAGVDADVCVGDLFEPGLDLDADVHFAYLAPATLQRLLPRLSGRGAARLATVDFDVPGLVPSRRRGDARLYVLPGERRAVGAPGWPSAGTLVATVPHRQSLTCLDVVHPGGPTSVRLSGQLGQVATAFPGSDHLDGAAHLAVDVRWEPMAPGTVAGGAVVADGVAEHGLFVVVGDEEEVWDLDEDGVAALRGALGGPQPPSTLAEVLDATAGRVATS